MLLGIPTNMFGSGGDATRRPEFLADGCGRMPRRPVVTHISQHYFHTLNLKMSQGNFFFEYFKTHRLELLCGTGAPLIGRNALLPKGDTAPARGAIAMRLVVGRPSTKADVHAPSSSNCQTQSVRLSSPNIIFCSKI